MTSPRVRRLIKEHSEMLQLARESSLIHFVADGPVPSDYSVTLHCNGLRLVEAGTTLTDHHRFDIHLGQGFPTESPTIVWKTPIFHPNFRDGSICLGNHWAAGGTLAELCTTICEMVQYKQFNIYDPLDMEAAAWLYHHLEVHPEYFPVDERPVRDLNFEIASIHLRETQDHGDN